MRYYNKPLYLFASRAYLRQGLPSSRSQGLPVQVGSALAAVGLLSQKRRERRTDVLGALIGRSCRCRRLLVAKEEAGGVSDLEAREPQREQQTMQAQDRARGGEGEIGGRRWRRLSSLEAVLASQVGGSRGEEMVAAATTRIGRRGRRNWEWVCACVVVVGWE